MKVLVVNDDLEHGSLSVPRLAHQLARHLAAGGTETALLGAVADPALEGERRDGGLTIFQIHSDYPMRFRAYRGLYNPATVRKFRDIVSRWRPDVVHFHNVHTHLSFYCLKVARRLGARVILTAHDVMLFWSGKLDCFDAGTSLADVADGKIDYRTRWWRELGRQRLRYLPLRNTLVRSLVGRHAQRIVSVSDCLRHALALNGYRNTTTIHNGVPAGDGLASDEEARDWRRRLELDGKRVVFAGGRLSPLKGIEQLLRAVARLGGEGVHLIIAGRGSVPYEGRLRRLAADLGLERRTLFTGWIEGGALRSAFAAADVCVNPSLCFETLSMFNLEAMAAGRPVVTTFFGGACETIVDGDNGRFVNPHRIDDLAARLGEVLDDEAARLRMGERGRERAAAKFDAATQMERVRELYHAAS
ncbi:MAG: glycosyltransferase family 4 protein [Candidatus Binatia bacterium]